MLKKLHYLTIILLKCYYIMSGKFCEKKNFSMLWKEKSHTIGGQMNVRKQM